MQRACQTFSLFTLSLAPPEKKSRTDMAFPPVHLPFPFSMRSAGEAETQTSFVISS